VIIETNKTTARIFPEVPDCETPEFWEHMENLIVINRKLIAVGQSDAPAVLKTLQRLRCLKVQ
jgi:magnesium-protoporphyrin IX monomethyl ester (oxidative) cyclase